MKFCPGLNADVNVSKDFMKVFNVMLFKFQILSVIAETKSLHHYCLSALKVTSYDKM